MALLEAPMSRLLPLALLCLSACAPVLSNMPPVPMTSGKRAAIAVGASGGLASGAGAEPESPTGSLDGGVSLAIASRRHLDLGVGASVLGGSYWGERAYHANAFARTWVLNERSVDLGMHAEVGILATRLGERLLPLPTGAFGMDLALRIAKGLDIYSNPSAFPVGARLPVGLSLRAGPLSISAEGGYLLRMSFRSKDLGPVSVPDPYNASAPYFGARLFLVDKLAHRKSHRGR